MNGRLSVIPGKDVTIENLCYCQTKPTSSKLIHTQTSIRRLLVSLLYVMVALCNRAYYYIFALWFLLSSFVLLFSSPNLSSRRLDVYTILRHMVWP